VEPDGTAEKAQRVMDAWNRRDLDALLGMAAPDIEYVNAPTAVEPGTRRGLDEYASVLRAQWADLGDARVDVESLQTLGDEVFAQLRLSRTLAGSDARVDLRAGMRLTYRGGQLARQEVILFEDFPEALRAAGFT
jgi:ketosteroid isomerase-like protein